MARSRSTGYVRPTAWLLSLGLVATPLLPGIAAPVLAQSTASQGRLLTQFSQAQVRIPAGTYIPTRFTEAERIVVTPEETAPVNLVVASDIRSSMGTILIPAGSTIQGELRPVGNNEGTQFVANTIVLRNSNRAQAIVATSNAVNRRETISKGTNTRSILTGAAVGAAAAAVIAGITGDRVIEIAEVLGGAGLGALTGWLIRGRRTAEVIIVEPNQGDLDLRLQADLVL
ncbi:hypothetical protein [Trichothermofontia sp.]